MCCPGWSSKMPPLCTNIWVINTRLAGNVAEHSLGKENCASFLFQTGCHSFKAFEFGVLSFRRWQNQRRNAKVKHLENRQEIPNFMVPKLKTSLGLREQRVWVSQSLLLCDRIILTSSAPSRQWWLVDYPGMGYLDCCLLSWCVSGQYMKISVSRDKDLSGNLVSQQTFSRVADACYSQ